MDFMIQVTIAFVAGYWYASTERDGENPPLEAVRIARQIFATL